MTVEVVFTLFSLAALSISEGEHKDKCGPQPQKNHHTQGAQHQLNFKPSDAPVARWKTGQSLNEFNTQHFRKNNLKSTSNTKSVVLRREAVEFHLLLHVAAYRSCRSCERLHA